MAARGPGGWVLPLRSCAMMIPRTSLRHLGSTTRIIVTQGQLTLVEGVLMNTDSHAASDLVASLTDASRFGFQCRRAVPPQ